TESARALACVAAALCDAGHHAADEATRRENMAVYEFLVPIVKGWSTEASIEVASLGVQVHGGMGFIEETGAAQYYRDARILTIYEGTTAIQANDLVGRKTVRDGGAVARALMAQLRQAEAQLARHAGADLHVIGTRLAAGRAALERAIAYVLAYYRADAPAVFVGSVPYLKLAGIVLSGWQMARAALVADAMLAAGEGDAQFLAAKIATARFHADHLLTQAPGLCTSLVEGAAGALLMPEAAF
ncbi:MAG: acyl-CoA dehydrogenase C-terminal domain-containing protein, partial [Burkholderiaceae bacterium]|nr:acyl-CoA dehydrogenase C-terminal domain-containing protein [Burkholderiaceae bacterium]